jgi:hypothetical protein
MNFGEIVLQVGCCSDGIIQQIYPVHLLVIVVLISIYKNIYVRKQNGGWRGVGVKKTCLPGDSVISI